MHRQVVPAHDHMIPVDVPTQEVPAPPLTLDNALPIPVLDNMADENNEAKGVPIADDALLTQSHLGLLT